MEQMLRNGIQKRKRPQHSPTFALREDSTREGLIPSKKRAQFPGQSDLPGHVGRLRAISRTAETSLPRSWRDTTEAKSSSPSLNSKSKRQSSSPRLLTALEAATELSPESRLERLRDLRSKVQRKTALGNSEGLSGKPPDLQIPTLNTSGLISETLNKFLLPGPSTTGRVPLQRDQQSSILNSSKSQRPTENSNQYSPGGKEFPLKTPDNGPRRLTEITIETLEPAQIDNNMDKSPRSPGRTFQVRTTVHYTISEDYTNKSRAVDNRLCALSDKHPTAAAAGRKDGNGEFTLNTDIPADIVEETATEYWEASPTTDTGQLSPSNVLEDFDFDKFLQDDSGAEPFDFDSAFAGMDETR